MNGVSTWPALRQPDTRLSTSRTEAGTGPNWNSIRHGIGSRDGFSNWHCGTMATSKSSSSSTKKAYATESTQGSIKTGSSASSKTPHYTGYTFWDYQGNNENYAKSLEQAHEAIISPEDWETVQKKFASRRPAILHPRTVAAEHLFNDLGVCTQCGHKMGIKGSKNNMYMFFVCCNRLKFGVKACDMPRYPLSQNDPIIMDAITQDILIENNGLRE